ncbi:MAG TPA: phenylalanine--tRNA ligase subunit alpha [Nanoarchaeota archaeon]|nr:phenylalanine--tRNA ligase subunit alpha [Nanoarchaeota archaeon]
MDNVKQVLNSLHPLERKTLPFLKEGITLNELIGKTGLKDVEVMRALQWMENKGIIKIRQELKEVIELDRNGEDYKIKGLPEKRFLQQIAGKKEAKVSEIDVPAAELNIALGMLRQRAAISLRKDEKGELIVSATDHGKSLAGKESLEELFLKKLPTEVSQLQPEDRFAYDAFRKRREIIKTSVVKIRSVELTELGKQILNEKSSLKLDVIDALTPQVLKEESWKHKDFRAYDIKINVPKIFAGKKQHYRAFIDMVRGKLVSMGFKEMSGPVVESDFWDMDALYMPQFHSARDIHDAYYIKDPKYGQIDETIMKKVKAAHENGFGTGSKGWRYAFDVLRTKRLLLRTQGTACSARKLASKDVEIPGKYFGITRCFRYDVVDATHNCDFNQTEGFVAEEGLTFGHLKGMLKMFAEEFAQTETIRIVPDYFPFTEPSAGLLAKHPEMGWIELAGSGMFRPEMTKPLGIDVPVIAWGIGVDRLAMFALNIKDIRQLYSHELPVLRSMKVMY